MTMPQTPQAPPVDQLYQSALRDYNSAKYTIATSEFGDVIHFIRRILWREMPSFIWVRSLTGKASTRLRSRVTMRFWSSIPATPRLPAAELRKGQSLIEMGQKEAGVRELRTLDPALSANP